MLWKRLSRCTTVYLVAAVLLAFHLTRTEASILRKTERRHGRKEVTETASGIREGVIVFGKASKNASLDDSTSYQADSPVEEFRKGNPNPFKEDQWKRMSPSLLCGSDQMRFRAVGSPVKFLALDQHPPIPLSHVPSSCGYNMQSNPFGLTMNVPFHGCYVVQEDANYSLPLLWNNIPVTLKCPKTQDGSTTAAPQVPVFPSPFMYPWLMPKPQEPTTAAPQDPALPQAPLGFLNFFQLWNQQLQNQDQSTTAAPAHDPAFWNAFLYWQQLLQNQYQSSTAPQDPVPQMPRYLNPHYLYHLNKLLYKAKEPSTSAPDDQNRLASLFHSLYKYPWVYGLPNVPHQSKPGSYDFNSYLAGQVSKGAPATASPPFDYSWYSQSVNVPWWPQRNVPAAEPTNTPSYTPQYGQVPGWYYAQLATATPPPKAPGQMFLNPPIEVSKLQQNFAVPKSK